MKKIIYILLIALLFLTGCSQITQSDAEEIAEDFISKRVKFYSKDREDSTLNMNNYTITINSYKEGSDWVVLTHVSSNLGNETKKNDMITKVDRNGKVIEFMGQKVNN